MKAYRIGHIPAVLYGEPSRKGYLYIHGQGGHKEEAEAFAQAAVPAGYQVFSIDLPQHGERKDMKEGFDPWTAVPELQTVLAECRKYWDEINIYANSIGAYFAMLAFQKEIINKALFVSPIVNMEQLILDMMKWAGVSEEELHDRNEIETDFGQTLSWPYLCWVRQHPINTWHVPTAILYAEGDNLTSYGTVAAFVKEHQAELTVYQNGEHWFHTTEEIKFLRTWEQKHINQ